MRNRKSIYGLVNLLVALVIFVPLVILFIWSIAARWPWPNLLPEAFTLRGIEDVLKNPQLFQIIISSILLSLIAAILSVVIALCTARALADCPPRVRRFFQFTFSLPFLVPATIFAMGIHVHLIRWRLSDTFYGVILVHLIYSLPYANLLITDGYQALGLHLEEQARMLGASGWQAFKEITLPMLSPVIFTSLAMSYIVSFSQYFLTLLIGGGRVQTFMVLLFPYMQNNDRTIASIYSLLFLFVSLFVFALFEFISKYFRKKYHVFSYH